MIEGSIGVANNGGWLGAMKRGLKRCCPRCGARGMFTGYLKVAKSCHRCGLDFESIRSDDVAPYFTILIVGHIVVPLLLSIEQWASPPAWIEMAIGLPATLIFTLALLPFIKGAVMSAIWVSKPELAHKG
jgi:uncharacterized protein (DUF983 family)